MSTKFTDMKEAREAIGEQRRNLRRPREEEEDIFNCDQDQQQKKQELDVHEESEKKE